MQYKQKLHREFTYFCLCWAFTLLHKHFDYMYTAVASQPAMLGMGHYHYYPYIFADRENTRFMTFTLSYEKTPALKSHQPHSNIAHHIYTHTHPHTFKVDFTVRVSKSLTRLYPGSHSHKSVRHHWCFTPGYTSHTKLLQEFPILRSMLMGHFLPFCTDCLPSSFITPRLNMLDISNCGQRNVLKDFLFHFNRIKFLQLASQTEFYDQLLTKISLTCSS